jgi:hypothetical protein
VRQAPGSAAGADDRPRAGARGAAPPDASTDLIAFELDTARWVREQIRDGCDGISLRVRVDGRESLVDDWRVDAKTDVDALVRGVHRDKAVSTTDGHGLYALFSHRPDTAMHVGRRIFCVRRSLASESGPPMRTPDVEHTNGLLLRSLRHLDRTTKVTMDQALSLLDRYSEILNARDARIAVLEARVLGPSGRNGPIRVPSRASSRRAANREPQGTAATARRERGSSK